MVQIFQRMMLILAGLNLVAGGKSPHTTTWLGLRVSFTPAEELFGFDSSSPSSRGLFYTHPKFIQFISRSETREAVIYLLTKCFPPTEEIRRKLYGRQAAQILGYTLFRFMMCREGSTVDEDLVLPGILFAEYLYMWTSQFQATNPRDRTLDLSGVNYIYFPVDGVNVVVNKFHISRLDVSGSTGITADDLDLLRMPRITHLNLSRLNLTRLPAFFKCQKLVEVDMSHNALTTLDPEAYSFKALLKRNPNLEPMMFWSESVGKFIERIYKCKLQAHLLYPGLLVGREAGEPVLPRFFDLNPEFLALLVIPLTSKDDYILQESIHTIDLTGNPIQEVIDIKKAFSTESFRVKLSRLCGCKHQIWCAKCRKRCCRCTAYFEFSDAHVRTRLAGFNIAYVETPLPDQD